MGKVYINAALGPHKERRTNKDDDEMLFFNSGVPGKCWDFLFNSLDKQGLWSFSARCHGKSPVLILQIGIWQDGMVEDQMKTVWMNQELYHIRDFCLNLFISILNID